MKKIKKILIANRGEIALRVIHTCKEMGIKTVAIYSEVDKNAPFVISADESYCIGQPQSSESYLNIKKIVELSIKCDVDAVHPGYGFLSENPKFAEALMEQDITFIGPSPESMKLLGDKTAARRLAKSLNIPITPGSVDAVKNISEAREIAENISFPVLLKAAGGGGGKGMRIVNSYEEFDSAFRLAQSEALSAFADDRIFVEKYIENPKHIEIQILADKYGNVIHLGERDCSIQRRHQKIIEESPSVILDEKLRFNLCDNAIKLVKASKYFNACTVEFLVDKYKNFYFLEVNTRLQVEHPVTEMRTGIDLVREQIIIAEGGKLSFEQKDINFSGHAIECRIYAEDPCNNFFPSIGKIKWLNRPDGPFIRVDSGISDNSEISPYYDPLLSKIITFGQNRDIAIERMLKALNDYQIFGVINNIPLCKWVLSHNDFRGGFYDTHFLSKNIDKFIRERENIKVDDNIFQAIIASVIYLNKQSDDFVQVATQDNKTRWIKNRYSYFR